MLPNEKAVKVKTFFNRVVVNSSIKNMHDIESVNWKHDYSRFNGVLYANIVKRNLNVKTKSTCSDKVRVSKTGMQKLHDSVNKHNYSCMSSRASNPTSATKPLLGNTKVSYMK